MPAYIGMWPSLAIIITYITYIALPALHIVYGGSPHPCHGFIHSGLHPARRWCSGGGR